MNGESISVDDFEAAVEDAGAVDAGTETADATTARSTLAGLITDVARGQFLRAHGIEPVEGQIERQLRRLHAPDVSTLSDIYAERPATLGLICARLIPVADEAAGVQAAAALAGGEGFADVATRYSTEPSVTEYDGWLSGDATAPCLALTDLQFDARLAATFVNADPGEPVGPFVLQTAQGPLTFVTVVAEIDEVADAIEAFYDDASQDGSTASVGELLFRGWLLDADVTVNARYGRWDAASASIVPLGQE